MFDILMYLFFGALMLWIVWVGLGLCALLLLPTVLMYQAVFKKDKPAERNASLKRD